MTPALAVVVTSPDEIVWQGEANSLSSVNSVGVFDILPGHANFITLIQDNPITVREASGTDKVFKYKRAVLVIENDKINIYVDI